MAYLSYNQWKCQGGIADVWRDATCEDPSWAERRRIWPRSQSKRRARPSDCEQEAETPDDEALNESPNQHRQEERSCKRKCPYHCARARSCCAVAAMDSGDAARPRRAGQDHRGVREAR